MIKSTQRIFIPGSKWVYFKIYAGHKTLENILVKDVYSIISKLKKEQIIEKWFFIRYADPDSHLRIRILLNDEIKVGDTVNMIYRQLNYLVKDNFIWKIQLDTYHRELERYGNRLIEDTETLFFRDSECILSIIRLLNINKNEDFRWMIALRLIDCLLSDFNFNLIQKHSLMENISDSFKKEYGFNQYNSKQFNNKFRNNKNIIEYVLNDKISDSNFIKLYNPINHKSNKLKSIVNLFLLKQKKEKVIISQEFLMTSYIHMMLNRLFMSKNRVHELVLYDFMRRYYTSEIARNKYTVKTNA